jgi:hypothetical protein
MGRYSIGPQQLAYGTFWYNYNQNLSADNTPSWIYFDTAGVVNGVSLSATNNSRSKDIIIERTGVYNIQFSAQVDKTTPNNGEINIWFKKNGQNIASSNGFMDINGQEKDILGFDIIEQFNASDVLGLGWSVSNNGIYLPTLSANGSPAAPSVIITIKQL